MTEMALMAHAVDCNVVSCPHAGGRFTVTRIVDGKGMVICEACFQSVVHKDQAARREANPICPGVKCFSCERTVNVRMNPDLGMGFCDGCMDASVKLEVSTEALHIPRADIVPDVLAPGVLFIGAKESAFNRDTLRRLGITRVLICCERLPAYHYDADPTIRYHRIPLQDSLAQDLIPYLPSALAFIAQGALMGERTLVHCNAGVSRSGSIAVEFLRRTDPALSGSVDAAIAAAKQRRPNITPNSNFVRQLKENALLGAHKHE